VVQADRLNSRITDTILAAISRSTHRASASQLHVDVATEEGKQTGLRQNSMIQCENLLTFDQAFVIATIGKLPRALLQQIDACLKVALDLP
jgi:mRNA interferase MazF